MRAAVSPNRRGWLLFWLTVVPYPLALLCAILMILVPQGSIAWNVFLSVWAVTLLVVSAMQFYWVADVLGFVGRKKGSVPWLLAVTLGGPVGQAVYCWKIVLAR